MTERNDPKRWREAGGPLLLLEATTAYRADGPSDEALSAMLAQVQSIASTAVTPNFDAGIDALEPVAVKGALGLASKIAIAALTVAMGTGMWCLFAAKEEARSPQAEAPRVVVAAIETKASASAAVPAQITAVTDVEEAAVSTPEFKRPKRAPKIAAPEAPAITETPVPKANVGEELMLLRKARRALAHAPAEALTLTSDHRASFPNGAFAEERELLAIEALSALGRRDAAQARVREFRKAFPSSLHLRRLEVVLGKEAPVEP